ncbi:MAG: hypothetical protein ACTHQQ_08425 [Solirubrobacteraceae bacterium]
MGRRLNMDPRSYEDGELVRNGDVVDLNNPPRRPGLEPTEGRIPCRLRVATYGLPKPAKPLRTEHMKRP